MKSKQAKLSHFLSPDGRSVHGVAPKQEAVTETWTEPVQKDKFQYKKRVLPSSIAKPALGIGYNGYGGTLAAKTANGFRPPDRIGDPNFYGPTAAANDQAAIIAREKRKPAPAEDITLSVSQKRVLDTIIARKSVFFTGAAGTGKSHVLKIMREVLESLGLGDKVSFTAPTGVAACNIRGLTIHAWAGIGTAAEPKDQLAAMVGRSRVSAQRWKECEILVIDEISMLSAELFDKLSFIGSRVRNDPRPFGGLQLVLCGDFYQLPPIGVGKNTHFCFEAQSWQEIFGGREDGMILLEKVFRQQNDSVFLNILNDLRRGVVTPQAQKVLGGKVQQSYLRDREAKAAEEGSAGSAGGVAGAADGDMKADGMKAEGGSNKPGAAYKKGFKIPKPVEVAVRPTKLFSTNKDVDSFNAAELAKLAQEDPIGDSYRYDAIDEGREPYLNQLRQGTKAPAVLDLRVGAQVMLLKNLSTVRGLVNGARGTVVGFEKSQNRTANQPYIPVVKFQVFMGSSMHEETISIDQETWDIKQGERVLASRVQIPLMLAWAISIHKSQGMTIPLLEVSFNNIFEYGQGYVALSRATCLEGLTLRSFQVSSIKAHTKVSDFYDRIHLSCSAGADPGASSSTSGDGTTSASDGAAAQVITTTVGAFAQAFVRDVPVPDTSDEWMESKNAKSAAFKKVVATYKSNIASHENDDAEEDEVPPGPGDEEEGAFKSDDDALMYTAGSAPAPSASTLRGNKFSQFSLGSSSSNNDWLDDEPTPSQRAASKNAYLRQFEKATTAYTGTSPPRSNAAGKSVAPTRAVTEPPAAVTAANTAKGYGAPSSLPASAVKSEPVAVKAEPVAVRVETVSAPSPFPPSAVKYEPGVMKAEPTRAIPAYSSSSHYAPAPAVPSSTNGWGQAQPQPQAGPPAARPAAQPTSLLHLLAPHSGSASQPMARVSAPPAPSRADEVAHTLWGAANQVAPTTSAPQLATGQNGASSIAAGTSAPAAASHLPPDVQRRIEQNRIAALERLQESRRKREEETSRMMQQYNL